MLPFTREQFYRVFASYNDAVWPAQVAAYVLGLVVVAALWRPGPQAGRVVLGALALMWLWTGLAYHAAFFATINRTAFAFALLFVVQAGLLAHWSTFGLRPPVFTLGAARRAHAAWRGGLQFGRRDRGWATIGWGLVGYAMVVYPLVGLATGHRYPSLPMFGIAPCPVVLFTFGALLLARPPLPLRVVVVPTLWALIGGSAAFLLDVTQDWPLLFSAAAVLVLRRRRDPQAPRAPA